ncbi:helix-turn-helix transcriptional regulator [Paenibacillus melissococcoides]|uniref:helix-turn-helix domain-containing protein n=1 Tax=Paenibacillus melissococcoides TaxID=2912268 RepID=UPI0021C2A4B8|nr:helix-turn-helix transcriptional regulator [Paenibacillus melissococcoides]CAH8722075.1 helix-turn-helix transcriptional regulator [Paenibacillus melissococcoides]CAH8722101.1 helix-turn-helix transcriptional regulator [Paenibacillus melissococcoides]
MILVCKLKELIENEYPWINNKRLAQDLGVPYSAINDLYNNSSSRLNIALVAELCYYFNVSPGKLIVLEEVNENHDEVKITFSP